MEKVEFYVLDGTVHYKREGVDRELTQKDRTIIESVLDTLERLFPDTLKALSEHFSKYQGNQMYFDFRRVDLFIRCNFSEFDKVNYDMENGMLNFEDVRCPQKGICKFEGIICRPKMRMMMHPEESKAAILYSKGFTAKEIAGILSKSVKTIAAQLQSVRKKLNLTRTGDLVKVLSTYHSKFDQN